MDVQNTSLPGVLMISPTVFQDERGYFFESWKHSAYQSLGLAEQFVQFNISQSGQGVLRGLHFQHPNGQGKLISVLEGEIFDVAVDIRPDSPSFRHWEGFHLSAEDHRQIFIPEGYAHGFLVLSEGALVNYLCTCEYDPEADASLLWNDPELAIEWPAQPLSVSAKDAVAPKIADLSAEKLPRYF